MIIYVPKYKEFVIAVEGDGSNLYPEDEEQGYADYMMIGVYKQEGACFVEVDGGGQMMTEMLVKDIPYTDVKRMVLDFVYPEHMHPKNEEDKLEILTIDKEYKYE